MSVSIPIIASINCYTKSSWISFAKEIENAGANAIEVNIMIVNTSKEYNYGETERPGVEVLCELKKIVKIPVIIKLSHQLTSPVALLSQLSLNGSDAVVLFNRSYTPDVDIKTLKLTHNAGLSAQTNFYESLRWIGIGSGRVPQLNLSISGGVVKPEDAIKHCSWSKYGISCSVLYKGTRNYRKDDRETHRMMDVHGFDSIESFREYLIPAIFRMRASMKEHNSCVTIQTENKTLNIKQSMKYFVDEMVCTSVHIVFCFCSKEDLSLPLDTNVRVGRLDARSHLLYPM